MTPDLRRRVDQIRDYLFGGGYPNPVTNAEQLAFLFFFYLVEGLDADNELRAEATGQASRFLKIYDEYKKAPEVTRRRMYLETMERVMGGTDNEVHLVTADGVEHWPSAPKSEIARLLAERIAVALEH